MKKRWILAINGINLFILIIKNIGLIYKQTEIQKPKLVPFQLQIAINNQTSNVNSGSKKTDSNGIDIKWDWFYIDLSINGRPYNYDDFKLNDKSKMITPENSKNGSGNHKDVFATPFYSEVTLLKLTSSINSYTIKFTFGTYYNGGGQIWYHAQLTNADNYKYNIFNQFFNTGDAGTKIVINVNGKKDANSANWGFHNYKFDPPYN